MNTEGVLKKSMTVLVIMLVLIIGLGFLLPADFKVERSIVIDAPPSKVYPWVGDLTKWQEWDPWKNVDQDLTRTYQGSTSVGDQMEWTGPQSGMGRLTILETKANEHLRVNMSEATLENDRLITFRLEDLGGKTRLHWSIEGENSLKPIGNYFALGLDRHLGNMYEQGLSNIKSLVETGALPAEVKPRTDDDE